MISVYKIDNTIKLAEDEESSIDLRGYLEKLSFDEVKSLQVIMYLGRDEDYEKSLTPQEKYDSLFEYFDKIGWSKNDIEISQMAEKSPLSQYLKNGKEMLDLHFSN